MSFQKKQLIVATIIFVTVTSLALASNFIRWDETPLEQSVFALPLGIGLMLEMPFLAVMGFIIGDTTNPVNYPLWWKVIPVVAGGSYASIYYFFAMRINKTSAHTR